MAHLVEIVDTMTDVPAPTATTQIGQGVGGIGMGMGGMGMGMGLNSSTGPTGVNDTRVGAARLSAAHKEWVLGYFEKMADGMKGRVALYRARIAVSVLTSV